jgi:hypothetical protein
MKDKEKGKNKMNENNQPRETSQSYLTVNKIKSLNRVASTQLLLVQELRTNFRNDPLILEHARRLEAITFQLMETLNKRASQLDEVIDIENHGQLYQQRM